jgi:hypothetical protein
LFPLKKSHGETKYVSELLENKFAS